VVKTLQEWTRKQPEDREESAVKKARRGCGRVINDGERALEWKRKKEGGGEGGELSSSKEDIQKNWKIDKKKS